jgi:hypothetical protein
VENLPGCALVQSGRLRIVYISHDWLLAILARDAQDRALTIKPHLTALSFALTTKMFWKFLSDRLAARLVRQLPAIGIPFSSATPLVRPKPLSASDL